MLPHSALKLLRTQFVTQSLVQSQRGDIRRDHEDTGADPALKEFQVEFEKLKYGRTGNLEPACIPWAVNRWIKKWNSIILGEKVGCQHWGGMPSPPCILNTTNTPTICYWFNTNNVTDMMASLCTNCRFIWISTFNAHQQSSLKGVITPLYRWGSQGLGM